MRDLLAQLNATLDRGLACVYCAVVATRGSTPQKAGAAMLVFPDGSQAGTLGGGCVEADVKRRVLHDLHSGTGPAVFTFQLDDDYGWDDGLICGGRMTILAHPLLDNASDGGGTAADYYRTLFALADRGAAFTEAIVLAAADRLAVGDRYLFDAAGAAVICRADRPEWEVVAAHRPSLASRPKPALEAGIAYLPTLPRITLLIVGGGHVGQAVARLAAEVDFRIHVLDDREKYACRERFPTVDRLLIGDIGDTLRRLVGQLDANTYALIVTRGHNHDEEALYHLAGSRCGYVGMIGSRRKVRLILEDLTAKGVSPEALARVRAPVGFDIGSQTVPEIAISIVAELIACRNGVHVGHPGAGLAKTV
jgi:xanthine dehydrogenase accessory factor